MDAQTGAQREGEDRRLAAAAREGCRRSFRDLVLRHERGVYNLLRRRTTTEQDAEDIAQETFLRAWRDIANWSAEWSFSSWLYSIAVRAHVDHLRRRGARPALDDSGDVLPGCADGGRDPLERAAIEDEARALWRIADRALTDDQRSALWLRYAEERDVADIAHVLGRSAVAVRVLLLRARRALVAHVDACANEATVPIASSRAVQREVQRHA